VPSNDPINSHQGFIAAGSRCFPRRTITWIRACVLILACAAAALTSSAQTLISVSPTQLSFGDQQAGQQSAAMTVTVTNIGNVSTNVNASTTPYEFVLQNPTEFNLAPGASNSFNVEFLPDLLQTFTGTMTISASGQPQPVLVPLSGTATNPVAFDPSPVKFGMEGVGLLNPNVIVNVNNVSPPPNGRPFITELASATPPFSVQAGNFSSIPPGKSSQIQLGFMPTAAGPVTGTLSVYIENVLTPFTVTLTGTGVDPGALFVVTPTNMNFPNVPLGSASAPQPLTITNNGTGTDTIESIFVPAPWQLNDLELNGQTVTTPVAVPPGSSVTGTITYFGSGTGLPTGSLNVVYKATPASGVSLTGSTVPATALAITTFDPDLMTQGAAYQAQLTATGGTGTYTWKLMGNSKLPAGLALSTSGMISGNIPSTFALGSYPFTVEVKDQSIPVQEASRALTSTVQATTGANCNNIEWYLPDTKDPLIALTDLGTGTYCDPPTTCYEGGLYPNGSNVDPATHDAAGVVLAQQIQAIGEGGGTYALLALGISTTQQDFLELQQLANADPEKNSHLVLVNGGVPGVQAGALNGPGGWADPTNMNWKFVADVVTAQNGVTADQVEAIWFEDIVADPTSSIIKLEQADYEQIAKNVLLPQNFPNVKLMFFSSSLYNGYSNNLPPPNGPLDPEPYAYETGFAVQLAIADQISGTLTGVPWMGWASYNWTNGLYGRDDGLTWSCQDSKSNGIHPSITVGREKVGSLLLNFFKTSDLTAPWFDAPGANDKAKK
jgi:hypothetical protein